MLFTVVLFFNVF